MLGLVWGAASLLFGLAVDYLGVALGISIQLGLSIVVGSLVPLLLSNALKLTSTASLGDLGTSFGWPIFLRLIVVTSNVWGVLLGEWRDRPRSAFFRMVVGSAILVIAVFFIAHTRPM